MLLRHARNGWEPLGPKAEGIPCSTYRRSPGRLSLAGCVPAEPASVSPAGRIVLFASVIVNLLCSLISGRDSLLLPPGLAGLSCSSQFGVPCSQDCPGPPGRWDALTKPGLIHGEGVTYPKPSPDRLLFGLIIPRPMWRYYLDEE